MENLLITLAAIGYILMLVNSFGDYLYNFLSRIINKKKE